MADDPGETIVVDPTGSVARLPNSSSRMAELQQAQHSALATFSLGQEGGAAGGSSSPGFDIPVQLQPINFSQPRNDAPTEIVTDIILLRSIQGSLKSSNQDAAAAAATSGRPYPSPLRVPSPNSAILSIVNASARQYPAFTIVGITSEVEDGRTVTITIVNSANQVVYTGTTTVTNGSWLLEISSAAAKLIPDGNYTVIADVTNASGNTGHASKTVLIDTVAAALEPAGPDCSIRQRQLERGQNHQCHHADGGRQRCRGRRHGDAVRHQRARCWGRQWRTAAGNWSITSSPLSDGVHQPDGDADSIIAGNASAMSAALSVTVDTVAAAPSAPDLVAASD